MIKALSYCIVAVALIVSYLLVFHLVVVHIFGLPSNVSPAIHAVNIVMLMVIVVGLPFVNLLSNHLDRLFNLDGYRIDSIVSKLNRAIVKNHDTESLLVHGARLVKNALGVRFVSFVVLRQPKYMLVAGSPSRTLSANEAVEITNLMHGSTENVMMVGTMADTGAATAILDRHRVAVIAKIKYETDLDNDDMVGYMLIGHKTKGKGFVQRDIDLLGPVSGLMALAIENAHYYQQVRSFNANLRQEIAVATSKLRDSNRKLRKLDDAKNEFVSMASHQLRTPLTSVKGYVSMLLDGDGGRLSTVQRHFLNEAYQSSDNMVRIIDDLLNVSRIQTGKFTLDKTNVDLAELARLETSKMVDGAVSRGLKLALNVEEGDYQTMVDALKVRQMMNNLIDNALYYSNSGGVVTVKLVETGKKIRFSVTDTGIGVPKAELPNLFTKFSRASNAKKRRPDGTGVGLFLVKKVAKAHGGGVFVESKEDQGSTFGFWLPK
jgi:signal transduction histidine kinase